MFDTPGIIFVTSKILNPTKLRPDFFEDWYENRHIQEVQATGGISETQRYESLTFYQQHRKATDNEGIDAPSSSRDTAEVIANQNLDHDFLTVYHLPDLDFRHTATFKSLAGQSRPSEQGLLETIFRQAEFCTRFCEHTWTADQPARDINNDTGNVSSRPVPATVFVITVGVPSTEHTSTETLNPCFKLSGFKCSRKYYMQEGSVLSAFQRTFMTEPRDLFIFEYQSIPDLREIGSILEDAASGLEIGSWVLKRDYDGSEKTPAPWKVPDP